jgi:hypothetical protein
MRVTSRRIAILLAVAFLLVACASKSAVEQAGGFRIERINVSLADSIFARPGFVDRLRWALEKDLLNQGDGTGVLLEVVVDRYNIHNAASALLVGGGSQLGAKLTLKKSRDLAIVATNRASASILGFGGIVGAVQSVNVDPAAEERKLIALFVIEADTELHGAGGGPPTTGSRAAPATPTRTTPVTEPSMPRDQTPIGMGKRGMPTP